MTHGHSVAHLLALRFLPRPTGSGELGRHVPGLVLVGLDDRRRRLLGGLSAIEVRLNRTPLPHHHASELPRNAGVAAELRTTDEQRVVPDGQGLRRPDRRLPVAELTTLASL